MATLRDSAVMIFAGGLLLLALALAFQGKRSRPLAVSLGASVLVFFLLMAMFIAADQFTGHGIDQSVLFHTAYGLDGAGFSEYSSLIGATLVIVLVGGSAAFGAVRLLTRTRERPRPWPTRRAALPIALLACALNPATRDLVEVFGIRQAIASLSDKGGHTSDFEQYYRTPKLGPDPSAHRNFVFIYAEGLERTYFDEARFPDLISGLRPIEAAATSFTNMSQTLGTTFTMGGIVGSQCGIPLITSSGGNSMSGMSRFLPNAVCLGDLLRQRGYDLTFLGGAALTFAGKGKFLTGHGFKDVQGREQLIPKLPDPAYRSGWGLHDDSLLDLAYDKFTELASGHRRFGLFLLTLDTHAPDGLLSKRVESVSYEDGSTSILNAVKGSERLISAFIDRIRASPHGKDTLIVVASDHLAMSNGASERLAAGERRNLFFIIDPSNPEPRRIDKPGTTLDIGPTVLHALGYHASVGLGRDLLSEERSLVETVPKLRDSIVRWKSELSAFWGLSSLSDIIVHPAEGTIEAGGTTIRSPALLTYDADLNTEVFFEFSSSKKLADYVYGLENGRAFVWVAPCATMAGYVEEEAALPEAGVCLIVAKRGAPPTVVQTRQDSLAATESQLREALDSAPDPALYAAQTERLGLAQLPRGLVELVDSLSPGSTFFNPPGRLHSYIKAYAQEPHVAQKNIEWTEVLPDSGEFYFASEALRPVKKARAYQVSRLPLGKNFVTLFDRYADGTVILSGRGDAKRRLTEPALRRLSELGLDLKKLAVGGSFAAVIDAGRLVASGVDNGAAVVLQGEALQRLGIDRVESAGARVGNYSKVVARGKDWSRNKRGLNIVILPRAGAPVSMNVDTHVSDRMGSEVYEATTAF